MKAGEVIAPFDDLECPLGKGLGPLDELAGVATVGPDQHQSCEQTLEPLEDQFGAIAILDVGLVNDDRQDQAERVDDQMTLAAIDLFAGIIAVRPPFSVVLTD